MRSEIRLYGDRPFGNADFWRAMLVIWNHFRLCDCVASYTQWKGTEKELSPEVLSAIRLFDCWLGVALENGWETKE